jgi:hypothetical protein
MRIRGADAGEPGRLRRHGRRRRCPDPPADARDDRRDLQARRRGPARAAATAALDAPGPARRRCAGLRRGRARAGRLLPGVDRPAGRRLARRGGRRRVRRPRPTTASRRRSAACRWCGRPAGASTAGPQTCGSSPTTRGATAGCPPCACGCRRRDSPTDLMRGGDARVAIVTGVSRRAGIGFAIARRLLRDGHRVLVHSWSAVDHEHGQPRVQPRRSAGDHDGRAPGSHLADQRAGRGPSGAGVRAPLRRAAWRRADRALHVGVDLWDETT